MHPAVYAMLVTRCGALGGSSYELAAQYGAVRTLFTTGRGLLVAIILMASSPLHGEVISFSPRSMSADVTQGKLYVINNAPEPSKSSELTVTYDLSSFPLPQTAYAALSIACVNGEPKDGLSSCLCAEVEGAIVGSELINAKPDKILGRIIVTDAVNQALSTGKKEITFTLSQHGIAGEQRTLLIDGKLSLRLQSEEKPPYQLGAYLHPIWKAGVMSNEPIFFLAPGNGGAAEGRLLFTPKKILSARSGDLCTEYTEGMDFTVEGNTIKLLPNSRIQAYPYNEFYPKTKEGQSMRTFWFPSLGRFALSPEGVWFHNRQIFFTYEHDGEGWVGPKFGDAYHAEALPKTSALLRSKAPIKFILFGDSISDGANASGNMNARPYMLSFGDLLSKALREYYHKDNITYLNPSLGGASATWGLKNVDNLVASEKPDLVILAFGMNGALSAKQNAEDAVEMMDHISKHNPNAEFILVAPIQPNSLWRKLEPQSGYAEELEKLRKPGVFIADLWNAHGALLKKKQYYDLTGNNVNHPNDFLIRIYAQSIGEALMPLK